MMNKWLNRLLIAVSGFSLTVIIYWTVANKGLGLVLNQAQAALFNGYYFPKLTGLILIFGLLILYAVLSALVHRVTTPTSHKSNGS